MKVRYKGKYSSFFLPARWGAQGTLLGLFLFLVLINDLDMRAKKTKWEM